MRENEDEEGSAWQLSKGGKPLSDSQLWRYLARIHKLIAQRCRNAAELWSADQTLVCAEQMAFLARLISSGELPLWGIVLKPAESAPPRQSA